MLTFTESQPSRISSTLQTIHLAAEECPVPQVELGMHNVTEPFVEPMYIIFPFFFFFFINSAIGDLVEVTKYLLELDHTDIHNLGLNLGLYYPRLNKMEP